VRRQSFEKFCAGYDFALTPAQRVLTRVCFDAIDPGKLSAKERPIADALFDDVGAIPEHAREVIVWLKGARIGGSRMAAMRLYQLGHVVELDLAPGESAFGLIVGTDMRLARQAYAYAYGAAKEDERAGKLEIAREGKDAFAFVRHDGTLITIECIPATAGGSAVRARTLVGAVITEGAFFRDTNFVVNDSEIFRALAPRIVVGGQLIVESTPWAAEGLMHELYTANHGHPTSALAAHCPTLLMRPDDRTRALVEREQRRDPDNADREFGALFMASGAAAFFDAVLIDRAMGVSA
jgi:hypothetical protein